MKVKPAEGRKIRDPETYALVPEEGIEVRNDDPFWRRRLRDGDAVLIDAQTYTRPTPHHTAKGTEKAGG